MHVWFLEGVLFPPQPRTSPTHPRQTYAEQISLHRSIDVSIAPCPLPVGSLTGAKARAQTQICTGTTPTIHHPAIRSHTASYSTSYLAPRTARMVPYHQLSANPGSSSLPFTCGKSREVSEGRNQKTGRPALACAYLHRLIDMKSAAHQLTTFSVHLRQGWEASWRQGRTVPSCTLYLWSEVL